MHPLEFGEGATPREIADPDRFPAEPASPRSKTQRLGAMFGAGIVILLAIVFLNPLIGSRSGHVTATNRYFSSGLHLGFGSGSVFGFAGQKLHVDYRAKVKSGSLVVHVWPTGLPVLQSSIRTIRLEQDANSKFTATLPYTGFYRMEIDTFRNGPDFDVDYEISWHVR